MFMNFDSLKSVAVNVIGYGVGVAVATAIATVGYKAVDSLFD